MVGNRTSFKISGSMVVLFYKMLVHCHGNCPLFHSGICVYQKRHNKEKKTIGLIISSVGHHIVSLSTNLQTVSNRRLFGRWWEMEIETT